MHSATVGKDESEVVNVVSFPKGDILRMETPHLRGSDEEVAVHGGPDLGDLGHEGEAGLPAAEFCRKHGISTATYYQWKSKYAGMSVHELKKVKELEAENARLKRMYAELENASIKDVLSRKL